MVKILVRLHLLGFLLLAVSFGSRQAYSEVDPKTYAGRLEMSGYQLKPYAGFEKNWHLVTVRYRKDTGEMRYTYANDLAWKSLKKGVTDYPNGSVFAKIGLATEDDPAFASSAVPSGARRYQLMVRNKKKHADTDGWGYALFDVNGKTFPGEPKMAAKACAACHYIVPERGFVFSQISQLSPFTENSAADSAHAINSRISFETHSASALPAQIKKYLPKDTKDIRLLKSDLTKNVFQGTLDEIRPTLAREVTLSSMSAVLLSDKRDMFSLDYQAQDKSTCNGKGEIQLVGVHSLDLKNDKVYQVRFCQTQTSNPQND